MKANKVTLVMQAIGMYVMHLPLYILFAVSFFVTDDALLEKLTNGLLIAFLALIAVVFPICIANIILSVISIFKGKIDPSKAVMKVKLALIPWYALNFFMCFFFVSIFFNPFMMIAIPVAIGILLGTTYFCMVTTSLPDVAYYFRNVLIKKEENINVQRVFTVIFLFIFCLDVVGSLLFYFQNKKKGLSRRV